MPTTTLIITGVMSIIQILGFIILIVMLIKQFKHGGALHGIIGLITCGFWTFIWGWLKHKSFELTKIMIVWTILIISPMIVFGVFGMAMVNEMMALMTSLSEEGGFDKMMQGIDKKSANKISSLKTKKMKPVVNLPQKAPNQAPAANDMDWSQKALALWKNGKYTDPNKALEYWNNAIQTNPKLPEAYNNRGLAYYELKLYREAIKDYSQAIRMKSDYSAAYNNRGNAYYEMLKYELAEADFNKSIQLNPKYAMAYLNRGLVSYQLEKNVQACVDFNEACNLGDCEAWQWAKKNNLCK
ncbi:MAG: tetratricopeptide repeat protein [Desulfobacterales bacterium]|nr:MAG: tetratricopeptide repeat protein [Desulfobacterales bacterium]